MSSIHPTAIIEDGAIVGPETTIGAYSVIGAGVVLGRENHIGPHVVIEGSTRIGDNNQIFAFASVGGAPQDLKFKGEETELELGNGNIIREYVTLHRGTAHGLRKTKIGNNNLFMACSHVAHDITLGDRNVFANSASLAGHVQMGSAITIGGLCGIHQFVRLGDHCFLGAGSMVSKDIPPFCMAQGDRAGLVGINRIGLERAGFTREEIVGLKRLYRMIFLGEDSFHKRVERAWKEVEDFPAGRRFVEFFMTDSKRGFTFPRHRSHHVEEDN